MNYRIVSESKDKNNSFEFHKVASDGKAYGIFKECSKYYIKTAPADKELVAEAYDYIGGWNNRKDYEYESYAGAQKNFDLKMMSINEAYGSKVNPVSLDPSKKQDFIIEGTDKMKAELARQRQIMANVNTIITEGSYIGVGDPEKVSGSNNENKPYTEKAEAKLDKDMPKASGKPESQSDPYGGGKAPEKGKDVKDGDVLSDGKAVAAEHPAGGKVARVNEGCEGGACDGCKDWGSEGIGKGNGDPKSNGWEMEDQEYVNEEINDAEEWDKGLPGSAGTGEADTDHNNDPYKETVNEGEEDDAEIIDGDAEGDEVAADEPELGDAEGEDELPAEDGDGDDLDLGDEEDVEPAEDELGGEGDADLEDEEGDDEYANLESEIEELRAEIESLKAEIGTDEEVLAADKPAEDELGGEEDLDLGDKDDDVEDVEFDDEDGEEEDLQEGLGWDALKGAFNAGKEAHGTPYYPTRQGWKNLRQAGDVEGKDSISHDAFVKNMDYYNRNGAGDNFTNATDVPQVQPGVFGKWNRNAMIGAAKLGNAVQSTKNGIESAKQGVKDFGQAVKNKWTDFKQNKIGLAESKQAYMDSIVESVVKDILSEETTVLHDFGKHPGYRKKPMELPDTGSDSYNGMKDWNDDSVHSEEPFGQKIGDGKPYDKLVQVITDNVLNSIKKKD